MLKCYRKLELGEQLVIGADTSAGGLDYSAAQFISRKRIDVPWVYHSKRLATELTNDLVPILEGIYNTTGVKPVIAYERNNGGVFEMERLATLNRQGKFILFKMPTGVGQASYGGEAVKYGWDTNSATRPAMLTQLKEAIDKQVLGLYDQRTVEELFAFVIMQTSSSWKAQAESGAHDDLVMALAIAWQLYSLAPREEGVRDEQVRTIIRERASEGFYV